VNSNSNLDMPLADAPVRNKHSGVGRFGVKLTYPYTQFCRFRSTFQVLRLTAFNSLSKMGKCRTWQSNDEMNGYLAEEAVRSIAEVLRGSKKRLCTFTRNPLTLLHCSRRSASRLDFVFSTRRRSVPR
jgi:hypothetical protein